MPRTATPDTQTQVFRNDVVLVGRLAAAPEERELPSGDTVTTWRLIVGRPVATAVREGARGATVDTLDCVTWSGTARRVALRAAPGDVLEIHGALRRRFWRSGAGVGSRCEVEVASVRRVARSR